ncbi:MAG: AraC family transcriptional regulator [Pirellulaceae bacterium]
MTFDKNHRQKKTGIKRERTDVTSQFLCKFEDRIDVTGCLSAEVVTADAWLLEIFHLTSGVVALSQLQSEIRPQSGSFGILYAPFSITRLSFRDTQGRLTGFAGRFALPAQFAAGAAVLELDSCDQPETVREIIDLLSTCQYQQCVQANPASNRICSEAKRLIDRNYLSGPSIAKIAGQIGVSHAHLSREFKREFGMTPSQYLHKLRVADAAFLLAQGEKIVNVAMDVGYGDLSRFYNQFRKNTNASPGFCQGR